MKNSSHKINQDNLQPISVHADKKDSRWITVDENNKKISEATTVEEAIDIAEKVTSDFTVMFLPQKGETYIF